MIEITVMDFPGSPQITAVQAMSDIYKTLPDDVGKDWFKDSRINETLEHGVCLILLMKVSLLLFHKAEE